ncbi:hypothetical protein L6R29_12130 [Myxococcota bacterium]|nr:hypothetical protein [Myxococcota bacterium]
MSSSAPVLFLEKTIEHNLFLSRLHIKKGRHLFLPLSERGKRRRADENSRILYRCVVVFRSPFFRCVLLWGGRVFARRKLRFADTPWKKTSLEGNDRASRISRQSKRSHDRTSCFSAVNGFGLLVAAVLFGASFCCAAGVPSASGEPTLVVEAFGFLCAQHLSLLPLFAGSSLRCFDPREGMEKVFFSKE